MSYILLSVIWLIPPPCLIKSNITSIPEDSWPLMIAWQVLGQNTWPYVEAEFSQADMFKDFWYTGLLLMSQQ